MKRENNRWLIIVISWSMILLFITLSVPYDGFHAAVAFPSSSTPAPSANMSNQSSTTTHSGPITGSGNGGNVTSNGGPITGSGNGGSITVGSKGG